MLRLLQGDVGSGKTLVAPDGDADRGRGRRAGGVARADRDPRPPAFRDAVARMLAGLPVNVAILTGREKGRARES